MNQQCVVNRFKRDVCDTDYVGYTCRHLHQRVDEHKNSVIGKHMKEVHYESTDRIDDCFSVLKKCRGKYTNDWNACSTKCSL